VNIARDRFGDGFVCERLPGLAAPYAYKTMRLNELLTRLGVTLGGMPGARMAFGLGIKSGSDGAVELLANPARASTAARDAGR
jgi:hypothetical protein